MISLSTLLKVANWLTISRILMVPVFMSFFRYKRTLLLALITFCLAAITDFFDGWIARKEGVTDFGKFMDPLADKLLVVAALISFTRVDDGLIPGWMVVAIIGREFTVTGLRVVIAAAHGNVISATRLGKYKASSQMIAISLSLLLLVLYDRKLLPSILHLNQMRGKHGPIYFMMYIPLTLTLVSGLEFLYNNRKSILELMTSGQTAEEDEGRKVEGGKRKT